MLHANLEFTGKLEKFIRSQVDENDLHKSTSDYLLNLVRQDIERKNEKPWQPLRDELTPGMKALKSTFIEVGAADVIYRNREVKRRTPQAIGDD